MQFQRLVTGLAVVASIGIGLSILRANEEPAVVPPQPTAEDQVAILVERIEKLDEERAVGRDVVRMGELLPRGVQEVGDGAPEEAGCCRIGPQDVSRGGGQAGCEA